jgi:hypothetical protein
MGGYAKNIKEEHLGFFTVVQLRSFFIWYVTSFFGKGI